MKLKHREILLVLLVLLPFLLLSIHLLDCIFLLIEKHNFMVDCINYYGYSFDKIELLFFGDNISSFGNLFKDVLYLSVFIEVSIIIYLFIKWRVLIE